MRLRTFLTGLLFLALAAVGWLVWEIRQRVGSPPPMVRDLHLDFGTPSGQWTARLVSEFPEGTPERVIVAVLQKQGFKVERSSLFPDRGVASYSWGGGLPCLYFLSVSWFVDSRGLVIGISGDFTNSCL